MGIASSLRPQFVRDQTAFFKKQPEAETALEHPAKEEEKPPESFSLSHDGLRIYRTVWMRNGRSHTTAAELNGKRIQRTSLSNRTLAKLADQAFLRSKEWPATENADGEPEIRTADIFCGCGAMSLGVWEACRAAGKKMRPVLAVDSDPDALKVFEKNFPLVTSRGEDVTLLLDSQLGAPPSARERELTQLVGHIDLAVAGPPCQGHSDLNNSTRRSDPRNRLYERVARFAELVHPKHIIIENVPAVLHDKGRAVDITIDALRRLGYNLENGVVEISSLGVAQRRRRHALIASLRRIPALEKMITKYRRPAPNIRWAIADLRHVHSEATFDTAASPNAVNRKRIEYLFAHNCYNLPDTQRPDCHKFNEHSYRSVYGRLHWDKPAQTITSGFGCMGQGRFVHPREKRTITPHEATRLQFIPDFFSFDGVDSRTALARIIANAVPPKLTYVLALELIG